MGRQIIDKNKENMCSDDDSAVEKRRAGEGNGKFKCVTVGLTYKTVSRHHAKELVFV